MSAKTHLLALVQQVRHLLDCQFAILFLGCSDPLLCHPILSRFSFMQAALSTDDVLEYNPSYGGTLSALCDITIQTGLIWRIDCCTSHHVACSMLAIPLESPRGTLGVIVCLDAQQESFLCGEYTLLLQYLPTLVQRVEMVLHDACSSSHIFVGDMLTNIREQNKFISMVSHELRSPLTAIKGYAGLLHAYGITAAQDECTTKEMTAARQRQYLSAIIEQVDHMALLISDLLDASRIQAGRLALHCREINVSPFCQRILQIMQDRVDNQSPGLYRFRCTIEPDLPLAWGDPDRVQQILVNLLENAVKYSPNGGVIEIIAYTFQPQSRERTRRPSLCSVGEQRGEDMQEALPAPPRYSAPCMLGITIRDRGIGIPYPQQHTLFQPFIRLKHPATSQIAGSGLGLYISRRLVETMHGHIFLHSKEGKGTSVTFTLPTRCIE